MDSRVQNKHDNTRKKRNDSAVVYVQAGIFNFRLHCAASFDLLKQFSCSLSQRKKKKKANDTATNKKPNKINGRRFPALDYKLHWIILHLSGFYATFSVYMLCVCVWVLCYRHCKRKHATNKLGIIFKIKTNHRQSERHENDMHTKCPHSQMNSMQSQAENEYS